MTSPLAGKKGDCCENWKRRSLFDASMVSYLQGSSLSAWVKYKLVPGSLVDGYVIRTSTRQATTEVWSVSFAKHWYYTRKLMTPLNSVINHWEHKKVMTIIIFSHGLHFLSSEFHQRQRVELWQFYLSITMIFLGSLKEPHITMKKSNFQFYLILLMLLLIKYSSVSLIQNHISLQLVIKWPQYFHAFMF